MFPECDWTVYIRMSMLVWIVSKKFGHLKRDDAATEQAWLEDLAANAMSLNRNLQVIRSGRRFMPGPAAPCSVA